MREKLIELLAAMLEVLENEDADCENVVDELSYELDYLRSDDLVLDALYQDLEVQ
jgi:hypothetical protein